MGFSAQTGGIYRLTLMGACQNRQKKKKENKTAHKGLQKAAAQKRGRVRVEEMVMSFPQGHHSLQLREKRGAQGQQPLGDLILHLLNKTVDRRLPCLTQEKYSCHSDEPPTK